MALINQEMLTPLATSFKSMVYAYMYHHTMKHLHTDIILAIFSIYICPKMCHKNFENLFTNKILYPKGFCIDKGDNPKSLTLNTHKIVNFIQTFGPSGKLFILFVLVFMDYR